MIDAPIRDFTQDDEVILKVTETIICRSDLHMQSGDILGHEVNYFV